MGLNWHKGAEGASRGLETVMGVQQKSIDMMYDEITRERDRNWKSQENQKKRDFTSGERTAEQSWRTSEREAEHTWKTEESRLDREIRKEDLEIRRQRIEEEREYRRAILADKDKRTEIYGQQGGGWSDEDDMKAAIKMMDKLDEKASEIEADIMLNEEQKAAKLQDIDRKRGRVVDYGASGAAAYEKMEGYFRGQNPKEAKIYKEAYAMMTPDERKKVDRIALKLRKDKVHPAEAYVIAIDQVMDEEGQSTGGGSTDVGTDEEASTGSATEEPLFTSPNPDTDTSDSVGAPAAGKKVQEVSGSSPDPMLEPVEVTGTRKTTLDPVEVTGTRKPLPAEAYFAQQKAKTVPLYEKTKPIRDAAAAVKSKGQERVAKGKQRETQSIVSSLETWLEKSALSPAKQKLLKRMHTKATMKKVLEDAGYTASMVEQFLKYLFS